MDRSQSISKLCTSHPKHITQILSVMHFFFSFFLEMLMKMNTGEMQRQMLCIWFDEDSRSIKMSLCTFLAYPAPLSKTCKWVFIFVCNYCQFFRIFAAIWKGADRSDENLESTCRKAWNSASLKWFFLNQRIEIQKCRQVCFCLLHQISILNSHHLFW